MTISQKDKDAFYALVTEFCGSEETKSAKHNPVNGHQGRRTRGADKLDLEVSNRAVRDTLVRFWEVYGKHTGAGQSEFLVHFLLHAMVSFDLDHGHLWGQYGQKIKKD